MIRRFLLSFALCAVASLSAAQQVQPVDRIVAIVDKDVVTMSELQARVAAAERELRVITSYSIHYTKLYERHSPERLYSPASCTSRPSQCPVRCM